MPRQFVLPFLAGLVFLAGCSSSTTGGKPATKVAIAPDGPQVLLNGSQQFQLLQDGASIPAVWTVNGIAGGTSTSGTITAQGLYSAPAAIPQSGVQIGATASDDSSLMASTAVSLAYPKPQPTQLSPSSVSAGVPDTKVGISGSGFTAQSQVLLDGTAISGTFENPSTMSAVVPAAVAAMGGTHQVAITNPTPGGGVSTGTMAFTIENPAPTVLDVVPKTVAISDANLSVSVLGQAILPGAHVAIDNVPIETSWLGGGIVAASIPKEYLKTDSTHQISVSNPEPANAASNSVSLTVGSGGSESEPDGPLVGGLRDLSPDARVVALGSPSDSIVPSFRSLGSTSSWTRDQAATDTCGKCPAGATCIAPQLSWTTQLHGKAQDWGTNMNCGLASLAMVTQFSKGGDVDAIYTQILIDKDGSSDSSGPEIGFDIKDLKEEAESKLGLPFQVVQPADLGSITVQLATGHPVIVGTISQAQNSTLNMHPLYCPKDQNATSKYCKHFMVVVGIDDKYVYVNDPGRTHAQDGCYRAYSLESFKKTMDQNGDVVGFLSPKLGLDTKALVPLNGVLMLKDAVFLSRYSAVLSPTQYSNKVKWSVIGGSLPNGLTLDDSDGVHGVIGGIPLQTGSFTVLIGMQDDAGNKANVRLGLNVQPGPAGARIISGANLQSGTVGAVLQPAWFSADGGAGPYRWDLASPLPNGLTLSADGLLSGTPVNAGSFNFTVKLTDLGSSANHAYPNAEDDSSSTITQVETIDILPQQSGPNVSGIIVSQQTVAVLGQTSASCVATDAPGSALHYSWSATGGSFATGTTSALVTWTAPDKTGVYTLKCTVTDEAGGSASNTSQVYVGPGAVLSANVSPTTGIVNSTHFTVTGVGATPGGVVTANSTAPDGKLTPYTTHANSDGTFQFGPFVPTETGTYSEVYVDNSTNRSTSPPTTYQVMPVLSARVSPTSGIVNSTQFTVTGVGATPGGVVTANSTAPDGKLTPYTTHANSDGTFQFGPFVAAQSGTYSEVYVDNSTNRSTSPPTTYQVTAVISAKVSPTSGIVNVTQFTVTGVGATPGGVVTANSTAPDGKLTPYTAHANSDGTFQFGPFVPTETGTYSEVYVDNSTNRSTSPPTTYQVMPVLSAKVSPTSGIVNSTQFTVTGVGATPGGVVTANSTAPDGKLTPYTTHANSDGTFQFGPFVAAQSGTYSEVYVDNSTNRSTSPPTTYQVTAVLSAKVSPPSGIVNSTQFTVTGVGATPGGVVTANSTAPDGKLTPYTTHANGDGSFQFGPFVPTETGTYSEVYVDNSTSRSTSPPTTYQVMPVLAAKVSPTSGIVNSTQFTVTGVGATPGGVVTANSTAPDGKLTPYTAHANSDGTFQFGPFVPTETGTYSEVYVDNSTNRSTSPPTTYQVMPVLSAKVSPTSGIVNSTQFTVTGVGATPGGVVTANSTAPDGKLTPYTTLANSDGTFQFGPFKANQTGTYSEVYVDNSTNRSTSPPTTYYVSPQ